LRTAVDPLVEFRGVLSHALAEAERHIYFGDDDSIFGELVDEQVRPAALALKREVRRSNALESLVAGGLIMAGGLLEVAATGKADIFAAAASASAGVAPWLVWRAKARLGPEYRGRRLLRDFLLGLSPDK
jgi:hypothetical protein